MRRSASLILRGSGRGWPEPIYIIVRAPASGYVRYPWGLRARLVAVASGIQAIVDAFRLQAKVCAKAGAPTCAAILDGCADDAPMGGPVMDVIAGWCDDPMGQALP